jgi:hypothetical protein
MSISFKGLTVNVHFHHQIQVIHLVFENLSLLTYSYISLHTFLEVQVLRILLVFITVN